MLRKATLNKARSATKKQNVSRAQANSRPHSRSLSLVEALSVLDRPNVDFRTSALLVGWQRARCAVCRPRAFVDDRCALEWRHHKCLLVAFRTAGDDRVRRAGGLFCLIFARTQATATHIDMADSSDKSAAWTALKGLSDQYLQWTEKESEKLSAHSFGDTIAELEPWKVRSGSVDASHPAVITDGPLPSLQDKLAQEEKVTTAANNDRRDAVLAKLRSWNTEADGRAPIRETTLQLWHTMVTDAVESRKRAYETKLVCGMSNVCISVLTHGVAAAATAARVVRSVDGR